METVSWGAFFPTRSDKGDEVCICFLMQVCFFLVYFGFTYLLTTTSALTVPCKESALFLGEGNHSSSFPRSQNCPSSGPPQLQPLIPGLGGCKRYLTRSIWGICAFSCSFHSLQLLLFGFFTLQGLFLCREALGTCASAWNYAMLSLPLPPWQAEESHPTSENMLRVPGAPWS